MKVKPERHAGMPFICQWRIFFVEPDNCFQVMEEYFLNFCAIHNATLQIGQAFKFNLHY